MKPFVLILIICCFCFGAEASSSSKKSVSSVWIFCGSSKDSQENARFLSKVKTIKRAFETNYHLSPNSIHVYCDENVKGFNSCRKNDIEKAFDQLNNELTKNTCLAIIMGHANSTAKDVNFNLAGPDISIGELNTRLSIKEGAGKLGIIWALEAGTRATKILGAENRVILAAAETEDRDNEPVLNEIFEKLLDPISADRNGDKAVSFAELQVEAKSQIKQWYQQRGLVQLEKIILDGNGDGIGTVAPALIDENEAKMITINF